MEDEVTESERKSAEAIQKLADDLGLNDVEKAAVFAISRRVVTMVINETDAFAAFLDMSETDFREDLIRKTSLAMGLKALEYIEFD